MKQKIQHVTVFVEFLAGSGLAIFFHWVLHFQEIAYGIFAMGALLSLATYLIREEMERCRSELIERYDQAHEISFMMAKITDAECHAAADSLIASAKRTMLLLQQGYVPLDDSEYYLRSARYVDESMQHVRAVDPVTSGWGSRGALINFYQSNLRALERGVTVTRIFVISRDQVNDLEVRKVIFSQLADGIDARITYREELAATGDREADVSYDFAVYDEHVATDVFARPGKYFGKKTRRPSEVERYRNLFDLIEHSSHPAAAEWERVEALSPAA